MMPAPLGEDADRRRRGVEPDDAVRRQPLFARDLHSEDVADRLDRKLAHVAEEKVRRDLGLPAVGRLRLAVDDMDFLWPQRGGSRAAGGDLPAERVRDAPLDLEAVGATQLGDPGLAVE